MKIRWPTIARSTYWRIASLGLRIEPWGALVREIPAGARVAIVGNAGYLLETEFGRVIDDCDIIIRMNNFRLAGYQREIGSRVDIVLTNFSRYSMVFENPDLQRSRLLVSSRPMNFLRHPRIGIQDRLGEHITAGMRAMGAKRVFVPDLPYFAEQVEQLGTYPTTGLMAVRMVVDVLAKRCDKLFLTGFSFFQGRSHYFSEMSIDAARLHNLESERREFRRIVRQHRDWIDIDPIMERHLEANGVVKHAKTTVADSRRIA